MSKFLSGAIATLLFCLVGCGANQSDCYQLKQSVHDGSKLVNEFYEGVAANNLTQSRAAELAQRMNSVLPKLKQIPASNPEVKQAKTTLETEYIEFIRLANTWASQPMTFEEFNIHRKSPVVEGVKGAVQYQMACK